MFETHIIQDHIWGNIFCSLCNSRSQQSVVMSSELPVVLPGREVRAHGVLAFLPQNLLYERRIGHMNCQDGTEAGLPHGPVPLHSFHLGRQREREIDPVKPLQAVQWLASL